MEFSKLSFDDVGKKYTFKAIIEVIKQTSGPTLMILNDGESNFTFKCFVKAGVRAYPEIKEKDYVECVATITKRFDGIEGEVSSMKKLEDSEIKIFEKKKDEKMTKILSSNDVDFSIKSSKFDKMKSRFIEASTLIKKSILENRPIILRHNADCDGYSSAITIERAIKKFYLKQNNDLSLFYLMYKRQPSKAPFYEYEDCFKDLTSWLKEHKRNNQKPPLIIITDNGSTEEDLLSIKQMKIYNSKIIVVDHHPPTFKENGRTLVDDFIDIHINPYLFGYDSNLCAGILGFELSRFIFEKNSNMFFIPAMASIIDHTKSEEQDKYIELSIKEGFTKEYLENLGEIIDMFSFYLKFNEAREFVDEIFGDDLEKQKQIVELFKVELDKRYKKVLNIAREFIEKKEFSGFDLFLFDGEKGTNRGEYPQIGKATNHIHRTFESENKKPIITATYGSNFITIRCSDIIENFSVIDFCNLLGEKHKNLGAEGGGHKKAGSVKFVEYSKEKVIEIFLNYLKSL